MPKIPKEDESCGLCAFCMPPPKRELIEYPDGQTRMASGLCGNPKSPLARKPLVSTFGAQMNAFFHKLSNPREVQCFRRKESPPVKII